MTSKYYVDTCIYLNLWQRKVDQKTGLKFWKVARDFLQNAENTDSVFLFSGFVLKEMSYILGDRFDGKKNLFLDKERFEKVFAMPRDYEFARELEKKFNGEISFFDCMHIVLTKKEDAILITRDEKLIKYARKYCKVHKSEELL